MDILDLHQQNYGVEGPKHLVVLWWEWPPIHWIDLGIGASINFIADPTPGVIPNQDLEGAELKVAIDFSTNSLTSKYSYPLPSIHKYYLNRGRELGKWMPNTQPSVNCL